MNVRKGYESLGIDGFYQENRDTYQNPHYESIKYLMEYAQCNWNLGNKMIDLCCGSGEVSKNITCGEVIGVDPYTYDLYIRETGNTVYHLSFRDIVIGKLSKQCNQCDTIICSYALHLCEESMLPVLLWQLGMIARKLIIITPHKRPDCDGISGWSLADQRKYGKTTMKLYTRLL